MHSSRAVILIIGMVRSGSSALTRVLSLSGCTLPHAVLGAQEWNPTGNWDPIEALKLNADFLLRHDTMLGDPTLRLQESVLDRLEKEELVERIRTFLTGCPPGPILVIKEQCITELVDFWIEGARRAGFSTRVVIPVRHPGEVFASMIASAGGATYAVEYVNAMWLKYNLLAERYSRALPRAFVEYRNLVRDWRVEVARVSKALSLELDTGNAAIDDFISDDLYRQRHSDGPMVDTFAYSWVSQVYSTLSLAARDGSVDTTTLDGVYDAYRMNERAFRMSVDAFRSHFNPEGARKFHAQLSVWTLGREF